MRDWASKVAEDAGRQGRGAVAGTLREIALIAYRQGYNDGASATTSAFNRLTLERLPSPTKVGEGFLHEVEARWGSE